MKRSFFVFILVIIPLFSGKSQEVKWHAGLLSFFDNIEFGNSAVKIPQTMAGVQFMPGFSINKDSSHILKLGVNLLHEFGSDKAIDGLYPTAYYEYRKNPVRFLMGAFPRSEALKDYTRLFFQDSLYYYRPNINGLFLGFTGRKNYLNFWLDWTGRQSESVREAFFIGMNGIYHAGPLYGRQMGYMFHFASLMNPVVDEAIHDNLLSLTSVGVDFSGRTIFSVLDANIGWVSAAERARADNTGWILLSGIHSEARIEYKFMGFFNTFYKGSRLMRFYDDHSTELYWGDPVYRAGTYDRADLYLRFLSSDFVNAELTYSLHFLEGRMYHEQMLKVKLNLNGRLLR